MDGVGAVKTGNQQRVLRKTKPSTRPCHNMGWWVRVGLSGARHWKSPPEALWWKRAGWGRGDGGKYSQQCAGQEAELPDQSRVCKWALPVTVAARNTQEGTEKSTLFS